MRTPLLTVLIGVVVCSADGAAQEAFEGWEFDGAAQAVLVASTVDNVERLPARNLLGEISVRATAEKTLQSSAEIGFRFEAKAQQDNPARAGFTGNIEPFALRDEISFFIPEPRARGAFSGLTRFGEVESANVIGSVETAQIYMDGGYGQVSAGLGRGVAARFHEGVPDIFTHARAANPKLDPGGLNVVRTENDLTGPSAKLTYQTPRILGLRGGVSYTPKANLAGVDRDAARSVPGVSSPEIENIVEVSAQFSRLLKAQDLRVRASASYAQGDIQRDSNKNPALIFDFDRQVTVWNVGAEFEFDTLSIGAEYLSSNNAIRQGGDYTAWSVGATKEAFGWDWGIRYGESEDENIVTQGKNWSVGGARKISQSIQIAAGYQSNDVELGQLSITNPRSGHISASDGVVVEITLSY